MDERLFAAFQKPSMTELMGLGATDAALVSFTKQRVVFAVDSPGMGVRRNLLRNNRRITSDNERRWWRRS